MEETRTSTEKAQPLKANSGLGLLETFNHALSSIIRHSKESSPKNSEESILKKRRPTIWFPDEDVRHSSESSSEPRVEPKIKIIDAVGQSIKQEESKGHFDDYSDWIDGSVKCRYALTSRDAQSHSSGWAMKYTNNHNKYVLKKTCVGVLVCTENCGLQDGRKVRIRPAISDKVRERQLGQPCPNPECKNGRIVHQKCTGNNGYPVTHFWVHHMDCIQFESKGYHDHPKPEAKRTAIRKRDPQTTKFCYGMDENMLPSDAHTSYNAPSFLPCLRPEELKNFTRHLDCRGDYVRSCDVTDGNEHVCVATAPMRGLAREMFSRENGADFSRIYVLCRTLQNYIPGFDLVESRLLSCSTPECPLVLATLYRSGTVDGLLEHIKHLTVMCLSPREKIRVPKWHYLVHDFSRELQTLAVETIVNLMVDSQMQTLLNEFQYKSVSSLYKMLRQKIKGTLRTFQEHYRICRYELILRIHDPRLLASIEDVLSRMQSDNCTAKEFLNIDVLIKGGMFGSQVREFWYFWGSDVVSSTVFPAAKIINDTVLCAHHRSSPHEACHRGRNVTIQEAFVWFRTRLEKRSTAFPLYNFQTFSHPPLQFTSPTWKPRAFHHKSFPSLRSELSHVLPYH